MHTLKTVKHSLLTLSAVIAYSAQGAWADYTLSSLGQARDYAMAQGAVAKIEQAESSSKVVLINEGGNVVLRDSTAAKSDIGLSVNTDNGDNSVYWLETDLVDGELARTIYRSFDGLITSVVSSANTKDGLTYDDAGNVAWVETLDSGNEIFFFDGTQITQVTSGHTNFAISGNDRTLQMVNGEIVWLESSSIFKWDGSSALQVSPIGQQVVGWPSFDGETVVWTARDSQSGRTEVFSENNGTVSQVTNDGPTQVGVKFDAIIGDGLISYQVATSSIGALPDQLFIIENGTARQLTEQVVNSVSIDAGKVVWTEGAAADTPDALFEYIDGVTSEIDTGATRITGVDADDGFIIWNDIPDFPEPNELILATPNATEPGDEINLGSENTSTIINLDESRTLVASDWNYQNWTPTSLHFGFTSEDGMPLDGITVVGTDGVNHPLSSYWSTVREDFTGEPVSFTILAIPGRTIRIIWWGMVD